VICRYATLARVRAMMMGIEPTSPGDAIYLTRNLVRSRVPATIKSMIWPGALPGFVISDPVHCVRIYKLCAPSRIDRCSFS
jgi:hypothetical protein